jgi:hypothetical protein
MVMETFSTSAHAELVEARALPLVSAGILRQAQDERALDMGAR